MTQSHYSLRWNNHQSHILSAFDALLQAETLVDVTLVCAETSVRAHKVVLSACSPFFQRIFAENPCKHPVIVLKDFHGWEVQAIVDFMYKGEISVGQEQLQNLIKAAESLQVRGLAHQDQLDKDSSPITAQTPTPSASPNDFDRTATYCPSNAFPTPGTTARTLGERTSPPPFSPLLSTPAAYEPPMKLPHMHPLFGESVATAAAAALSRLDCVSPIPRRKQARPRRRSGELCTAQDLSKPVSPPNNVRGGNSSFASVDRTPLTPPHCDDTPENLCIKKRSKDREPQEAHKQPPLNQPLLSLMQQHAAHQQHLYNPHNLPPQQPPPPPLPPHQQLQQQPMKLESFEPCSPSELDLSLPDKEYALSPPLSLPPMLGMHPEHHMDSHSPLPFPPLPSVSALAMTPPHIFGLDSPLSLFPPGLDGCRNPLLDLAEPRTTSDTPLFTKKKLGRPKGQHSAPRGGPPRSWTNAELTEALQHVWNKKMTTSQASRIFGIPYNSLLMYVRGKYGKSLKLEQLRKDCIGGPGGPLDLLALSSHNNNNQSKPDRDDILNPNARPPSNDDLPPPIFNPFAPNFYPDFGTGFPIPVSMIHLLPQSEKNRELCGPPLGLDDDCKPERFKELENEHPELFPRPPALSRDERRELVQHNGQN